VRKHVGPETIDLPRYRRRHAQYKTDPDLRAAHAAFPWIVTWDDHEVDNNYADDVPENRTGANATLESFLARRAAAYQAYELGSAILPVLGARYKLAVEPGVLFEARKEAAHGSHNRRPGVRGTG
jgi:hypothetical protein